MDRDQQEQQTDPNALFDDEFLGDGVDEGAVLKRCRGGDAVAWTLLIERYQTRLFTVMLRMVGNRQDAQDLTQDTFYKAIKGLKKFRGQSGFYTWLYRIGMNLCLNHLRRYRRMVLTEPGQFEKMADNQSAGLRALAGQESESQPGQRLQRKETAEQVNAALQKLDVPSRSVLVLRYWGDLNYEQMAGALGVPVGTVKSRLFRARMSLREWLRVE